MISLCRLATPGIPLLPSPSSPSPVGWAKGRRERGADGWVAVAAATNGRSTPTTADIGPLARTLHHHPPSLPQLPHKSHTNHERKTCAHTHMAEEARILYPQEERWRGRRTDVCLPTLPPILPPRISCSAHPNGTSLDLGLPSAPLDRRTTRTHHRRLVLRLVRLLR